MIQVRLSTRRREVARLEGITLNHPHQAVQAIEPLISPIAEETARHSDQPYVWRRQGGPNARQYRSSLRAVWLVFRYDHVTKFVLALGVRQTRRRGRSTSHTQRLSYRMRAPLIGAPSNPDCRYSRVCLVVWIAGICQRGASQTRRNRRWLWRRSP